MGVEEMGKIYYNRRIEGIKIPGIIRNGSYFYTALSVYEDGTIDCWHAVDLKGFRRELERGWVVAQASGDKSFSVSGIGGFEIQEARWLYDKHSFYEHVLEVVKRLNPELKNLHEVSAEELIDRRYAFPAAPGIPFRKEGNFLQKVMEGCRQAAVYRKDGRLYLTELSVYTNKHFQIDLEGDRLFNLEEITNMIEQDVLYAYPAEGEWLYMPQLGEIKVRLLSRAIAKEERIKEMEQWCRRTAGEEDAAQLCRDAYHEYLEWPTEYKRERLKQLYLAVPEHERMYLGDMDSKDSDYRRIIYHPESKRQV